MNRPPDQGPRVPEGAQGPSDGLGGQFMGPTIVVEYGRIDPRVEYGLVSYHILP